jgi:hypothetical protein
MWYFSLIFREESLAGFTQAERAFREEGRERWTTSGSGGRDGGTVATHPMTKSKLK